MSEERSITIGTAGHIDHGKSALVAILTGTDTDRLPEEKRRGISIDLGFAELDLGDGETASVIDVPGHERFIRTMVCGAAGIDMYLLAVAADDGVMPQTKEHVAVLRALGVERGVVAITKCDLVGDGDRLRAFTQARELLPYAPTVCVSSVDGTGVSDLRNRLADVARAVRDGLRDDGGTDSSGPPILHVDRAFTLRGVGTVVTGTLQGGRIEVGDSVVILPMGLESRVRSAHVHYESVDYAVPGQRTALNLAGVVLADVSRGDVVTHPGSELKPSYRIDVALDLEPQYPTLGEERVQVHHGSRDCSARVVQLGDTGRFVQLRLDAPLVSRTGDRVVLRRIAPPDTLGGAEVIDPAPRRHRSEDRAGDLALIRDATPGQVLDAALNRGPVPSDDAGWSDHPLLGLARRRHPNEAWAQAVEWVRGQPGVAEGNGWLEREEDEPTPDPPATAVLGLHEKDWELVGLLRDDGWAPRSPAQLEGALGFESSELDVALRRLIDAGLVGRAGRGVFFEREQLECLAARAVCLIEQSGGSIRLSELRDSLGTSRKYAQALLEYLDSEKVTIRRDEHHHLRKRPPPGSSCVGRQGSGGPPGLQSQ